MAEVNDGYVMDDSEWNEAKAYFYRIHQALTGSNQCKVQADFEGQLRYLFTVHGELSGQMSFEERKNSEKLYNQAYQTLKTFRQKNADERIITIPLYNYEIHLRAIMKDRKMDLPRAKDPKRGLLDG